MDRLTSFSPKNEKENEDEIEIFPPEGDPVTATDSEIDAFADVIASIVYRLLVAGNDVKK